MTKKKSLVSLANVHVSFPMAARWAGIEVYDDASERGIKVYCPFGSVEHPDGGMDPAMRIYPDHGWCFAESRYFSPVSLLAEVWQESRNDAAAEALRRIGWKPASYAHLFREAAKPQPPDQDSLAAALLIWCESFRPDWKAAQYSPEVATMLARCLGLLSLVRDGEECKVWLAASKKAMQRVLS